MLNAIGTLSLLLLLILFPLLIPALVTVGHAVGSARRRRHRPRNRPGATAGRVSDSPRLSAAAVGRLSEISSTAPGAGSLPDGDEPLRFPAGTIREPQAGPATKMVPK